jgi:hypothetical protein
MEVVEPMTVRYLDSDGCWTAWNTTIAGSNPGRGIDAFPRSPALSRVIVLPRSMSILRLANDRSSVKGVLPDMFNRSTDDSGETDSLGTTTSNGIIASVC